MKHNNPPSDYELNITVIDTDDIEKTCSRTVPLTITANKVEESVLIQLANGSYIGLVCENSGLSVVFYSKDDHEVCRVDSDDDASFKVAPSK